MTEYYNGRETRDVKRAWRARERAYDAYRSAWEQLRLDAIVQWRRDRHRAGLLARLEAFKQIVNVLDDETLDTILEGVIAEVDKNRHDANGDT